jgi:hypothetical protein
VKPATLTLGQLFGQYHEHKGRHLVRQWAKSALTRRRHFVEAWGADTLVSSISQTSIDTYCRFRRATWLEKHPERPLRDTALDMDFRWFSSVCNFAIGHKLPNGDRLLVEHPLKGTKRPREKRMLRPVATWERYEQTIAVADTVDGTGRLRLALALAHHTARRIDAILHVKACDVLLTERAVRDALAAAGLDENKAKKCPNGAIRWAPEFDKKKTERVSAITKEAREELDRYLKLWSDDAKASGAWLFRGVDDKTPPTRHMARRWLLLAEKAANLPKQKGGRVALLPSRLGDRQEVEVGHRHRRTRRLEQPRHDARRYQQSTAEGELDALEVD